MNNEQSNLLIFNKWTMILRGAQDDNLSNRSRYCVNPSFVNPSLRGVFFTTKQSSFLLDFSSLDCLMTAWGSREHLKILS
jgi:hypothetical protein